LFLIIPYQLELVHLQNYIVSNVNYHMAPIMNQRYCTINFTLINANKITNFYFPTGNQFKARRNELFVQPGVDFFITLTSPEVINSFPYSCYKQDKALSVQDTLLNKILHAKYCYTKHYQWTPVSV
jgi:hypothetical protein